MLVGAVLAYGSIVVLLWPVRRGGDVPVLIAAAVAAPLSAPYVGIGLLLPVLLGLAYALARFVAIDGPARPRYLWLYAAAAGWFVAAPLVLVRLAFHCGLF